MNEAAGKLKELIGSIPKEDTLLFAGFLVTVGADIIASLRSKEYTKGYLLQAIEDLDQEDLPIQ